jgi:hypothetical protein
MRNESLRIPTGPLVDGLAGIGPRTALRFDDDGFRFATIFGTLRCRWDEIDGDFWPQGSVVAFNLTREALERRSALMRWNCRIGQVVSGSDRQIKAVIFGKSPVALATLLNDQRARRLRLHARAT